MRSKCRTRSSVDRGPVTIEGMTVTLRPPRLADGPSWRETALTFTERLSPAFHRDDMDWASAHSPVMWVDTWRSALADARAGGVSYLLVRIDDGAEKVLGHFSMTGHDPRTGGAEVSSWAVDVPAAVSAWAQLTTVLSAFDASPNLPHALAPVAVSNIRANRFSESMGWTQLQTRRALRAYDGQLSDHHIWLLANTADYRDWIRRRLTEIPFLKMDLAPPTSSAPTAEYLTAWARFAVIRARQLVRRRWHAPASVRSFEISSTSGEVIHIEPADRGRYRVLVGGHPGGSVDVHSDAGTSTTELVPRLSSSISDAARISVVSILASHLADRPDGSRRTVVAVRDVDSALADRLAAQGFLDEGEAPPSLGEPGVKRRMWTLLTTAQPK
ncbi:GNAT family N-acetyltransferase [Mycobacteroides saopaulense]|uniref:GNAT family N-acetyltransferase n=1 Tax=Mycobacteroides saopaulense TaxID=1578165 RepID=UPI001042051B|nr:GNAT family N-acetyltransferase [Mycobacteroides saopaulense]